MVQTSAAEIFIGQSGDRALKLAQELRPFLRRVVHGAVPWVLEGGIEAGEKFPQAIDRKLATSLAGLVCLTPENQREPWILFEAGALSQKAHERVWMVRLDFKSNKDVKWPLGQFQNTVANDAEQMFAMVKSVSKIVAGAIGRAPQLDGDLKALFDKLWPDLRLTIDQLLAARPADATDDPDDRAPLKEILLELRGRRNDTFRIAKSNLVLNEIYRQVVGKPVPGIEELSQRPNVPPNEVARLGWILPGGTLQLVGPPPSLIQTPTPAPTPDPPEADKS